MNRTTSRRAVLAGAASLPALAVPALASSATDPVYAAIACCRAVDVAHMAKTKGEPRMPSPEYEAWEAVLIASDDSTNAARLALVKTVPTSAAGAAAMIQYALEIVGRRNCGWSPDWEAIGETRVLLDDKRDLVTNHLERMLETLVEFLSAQAVQS